MYTLGLDYGTNSCRAIIVDCTNGNVVGISVYNYPSGIDGVLADSANPLVARQNPADYISGLESSVLGAIAKAKKNDSKFSPQDIIGIGMDGTGSSPIPVNAQNIPLGILSEFKDNLNAQCWIWKDHSSYAEAEEITSLAEKIRPEYLKRCGGKYSSEWFWAKILRCLNVDEQVYNAAYSWVELSDYIPSLLAGIDNPNNIVRGVCMAAHKAMYCDDWQGLPDVDFLNALNPKLPSLLQNLYKKAYPADRPAGFLCKEWANKLGLNEGICIAIGEMDVHYGAIGCGISEGTMVKAIGTSTCDCIVFDKSQSVPYIEGISGIADGSILPDKISIEAGQSAVGDIFKWFAQTLCENELSILAELDKKAMQLKVGQSGIIALDWNNGNRSVLLNPLLTGVILGQTLRTTKAEVYRALVEATAFGARVIKERITSCGVKIEKIICCGGLAEKSKLLMQIYADVMKCEIQAASTSQGCALGAAISAAVCAGEERGGYKNFTDAIAQMVSPNTKRYVPIPANSAVYDELFNIYMRLHDSFGGISTSSNLSDVMETLGTIATKSKKSEELVPYA